MTISPHAPTGMFIRNKEDHIAGFHGFWRSLWFFQEIILDLGAWR
jgi:hypothetical protein